MSAPSRLFRWGIGNRLALAASICAVIWLVIVVVLVP
jgi:hypothetical protein